jgi:Protein of unknown function (DUF2442)
MAETTKPRDTTLRRLTDAEIDAQIPAARARAVTARAAGLRAKSARYDAATKRVVLELTNGTAFAFPARIVRGLQRATAAQRAKLALDPDGSGVIWDALDADISVPGVLAMTFGRDLAARTLGKAGGQVRSAAKAKASQANGAKGGRPRKQPVP